MSQKNRVVSCIQTDVWSSAEKMASICFLPFQELMIIGASFTYKRLVFSRDPPP